MMLITSMWLSAITGGVCLLSLWLLAENRAVGASAVMFGLVLQGDDRIQFPDEASPSAVDDGPLISTLKATYRLKRRRRGLLRICMLTLAFSALTLVVGTLGAPLANLFSGLQITPLIFLIPALFALIPLLLIQLLLRQKKLDDRTPLGRFLKSHRADARRSKEWNATPTRETYRWCITWLALRGNSHKAVRIALEEAKRLSAIGLHPFDESLSPSPLYRTASKGSVVRTASLLPTCRSPSEQPPAIPPGLMEHLVLRRVMMSPRSLIEGSGLIGEDALRLIRDHLDWNAVRNDEQGIALELFKLLQQNFDHPSAGRGLLLGLTASTLERAIGCDYLAQKDALKVSNSTLIRVIGHSKVDIVGRRSALSLLWSYHIDCQGQDALKLLPRGLDDIPRADPWRWVVIKVLFETCTDSLLDTLRWTDVDEDKDRLRFRLTWCCTTTSPSRARAVPGTNAGTKKLREDTFYQYLDLWKTVGCKGLIPGVDDDLIQWVASDEWLSRDLGGLPSPESTNVDLHDAASMTTPVI